MFYVGKDDKARQAATIYVGVNGVARQAKAAFIGVDGIARLCWDGNKPASIDSKWSGNIERSTISKLTFTRSYVPTGLEENSWTVSSGVDGAVMGYSIGTEVIIVGDDIGQLIVRTGYKLFEGCDNLVSIEGLELLDVSDAGSMGHMFAGLSKLASPLDLSSWDVSKVFEMTDMFTYCYKVPSINLTGWNTANCNRMDGMFSRCKSLTQLDLSSFTTNKVIYMHGMFFNCDALTSLDLTSFDTSKVQSMNQMFQYCENLTQVLVSSDTWINANGADDMFEGAGCSELTYV